MNLHRRLLGGAVIVAAATTLAIPVTAGASAGDRTFQEVYPIASHLCANVAAGTERRRLKSFAPAVLADCQALQAEFTAAQTTVLAARAVLTPQIAANRAAILAVCPTPHRRAAPSASRSATPGTPPSSCCSASVSTPPAATTARSRPPVTASGTRSGRCRASRGSPPTPRSRSRTPSFLRGPSSVSPRPDPPSRGVGGNRHAPAGAR